MSSACHREQKSGSGWSKELDEFQRLDAAQWEKLLEATNKPESANRPEQRYRAPEEADTVEPEVETEVVEVANETASTPKRKA